MSVTLTSCLQIELQLNEPATVVNVSDFLFFLSIRSKNDIGSGEHVLPILPRMSYCGYESRLIAFLEILDEQDVTAMIKTIESHIESTSASLNSCLKS